ncbi:hypothetical protein [Emergencia timonensis]|uniref:hypothetical protein n=1 Tax=Emergencia timonensis TaxID=1776384 RepID=UPI002F405A21
MYFTKGKQRAFELIMQQKPGFDRYQSGCAGDDEDCGTCRFYRPQWKYEFCVFKECPYCPGKRTRKNARQHGQIDGQKPLCHAALQTRKRQRAYCNTKTAENGFLIVHAYQERK